MAFSFEFSLFSFEFSSFFLEAIPYASGGPKTTLITLSLELGNFRLSDKLTMIHHQGACWRTAYRQVRSSEVVRVF